VVFGANFNKFGVLIDLNDQTTRKVTVCMVLGADFNKFGVHDWSTIRHGWHGLGGIKTSGNAFNGSCVE
jgi:hypothetical protein